MIWGISLNKKLVSITHSQFVPHCDSNELQWHTVLSHLRQNVNCWCCNLELKLFNGGAEKAHLSKLVSNARVSMIVSH